MTLDRSWDRLREWKQKSAKRYQEKRRERARKGELKSQLKASTRPLPRRAQPTTGFRMWVRHQERCCVPSCGAPYPDPHHVRARKMGRSRDPWEEDRRNCAPLCRTHHQLGDSPGWSWKRFEAEVLHGTLREVAERTWDRWMGLPAEERARWEGRAFRLNVRRGASPARRPR